MLWVKALHIMAVICWFAGLFYLPRLFVYHVMAEDSSKNDSREIVAIERFKIMERKLYYGITTPSMIATWLTGGWLVHSYAWLAYANMDWLSVKMALVLLLTFYHFSMGYYYRSLRDGRNKKSHKFFRFYNEIPVIFLILIVILVVVKPF